MWRRYIVTILFISSVCASAEYSEERKLIPYEKKLLETTDKILKESSHDKQLDLIYEFNRYIAEEISKNIQSDHYSSLLSLGQGINKLLVEAKYTLTGCAKFMNSLSFDYGIDSYPGTGLPPEILTAHLWCILLSKTSGLTP